jgi:tripeptidyl-peptidase-2
VESDDSNEPTEWKKIFSVVPGMTMEVCLAQFWSSLGSSNVTFELKFHGIVCSVSGTATGSDLIAAGATGEGLFLNSSNNGFTRLDISATLRKEHISFSASLDTLRRFIRPSESQVKALNSRDVLPDSRQIHELVLSYSVKLGDACSITCRFPRMNDVLYDSIFENFCVIGKVKSVKCFITKSHDIYVHFIVFDQNKKVLSFQDVYAKSVKVPEGSLTIKVQVASWRLDLLEKLQGMILVLDSSMSKSISLSAYTSLADCLLSSSDSTFKKKLLHKGERAVAFVGGVDDSALSKDAKSGDILLGKLDLVGGGVKLDSSLYQISYLVPTEFKGSKDSVSTSYSHLRPSSSASGSSEPEKEDLSLKRREAVRDLEVDWITKIKGTLCGVC